MKKNVVNNAIIKTGLHIMMFRNIFVIFSKLNQLKFVKMDKVFIFNNFSLSFYRVICFNFNFLPFILFRGPD